MAKRFGVGCAVLSNCVTGTLMRAVCDTMWADFPLTRQLNSHTGDQERHTMSDQSTTKPELSATMRDYLAEIYRLSERHPDENGYVGTSALADLLNVSAPAVNRMVTKLKDHGLLHHEPYQGIMLTDAGKTEALIQLRKHRIAESFLTHVMGFGWDEIYEEAHAMSTALSEAITQRMLDMSENPTTCPHGEPIPNADGTVHEIDDTLLTEVEAEHTYVVTRVLTRESDRLNYIGALGLMPDADLHVIHKAPFNGPMQLKLGEEYRIIGHNLAELIRVKRKS